MGAMAPAVLSAGGMTTKKGPVCLQEAFPPLLWHHPRAKFVFVGDGNMRWGLEHRARQLGVSHATRFLGHQNGHELVTLYKACDAVCMPSRNEPFGITALEGWAAGKPVVASRNGGPNEFVWHNVNGLKIYPDPNSVGWGLGTLFTNFEWARWMGDNGHRAVES